MTGMSWVFAVLLILLQGNWLYGAQGMMLVYRNMIMHHTSTMFLAQYSSKFMLPKLFPYGM